jgi:hypothetical protein
MPEVTAELLHEGVGLFAEAYDGLVLALYRRGRIAALQR